MKDQTIIILPAAHCRRSNRILEYLSAHNISFERIDLDSEAGQDIAARNDFRASPGILVNGVSINPLDLLIQPECRVDDEKAQSLFLGLG